MERKFEIKTMFNAKKPAPEKNSGLSLTVPDHAMSISEIMIRHSRGLSLTQKVPLYHEESELDTIDGRNPATMDIQEVHEELQQIAERLDAEKQRIQDERKRQQKERSAKREQEQRLKWKAEFEAEQEAKNKK